MTTTEAVDAVIAAGNTRGAMYRDKIRRGKSKHRIDWSRGTERALRIKREVDEIIEAGNVAAREWKKYSEPLTVSQLVEVGAILGVGATMRKYDLPRDALTKADG